MTEIELKFQVPAARRDALARAVATRTARRVPLRALYFDTAERALGRAGLALRVRKEGRRWVQALKGAGDGLWQRLEHQVDLKLPAGAVPVADPALHDGTPAGAALRRALGDGLLQPIYGTEVTRTLRLLRAPGCRVELAFDEGALTAGDARWPLCELELELQAGSTAALAAMAARWVQRFGLTLDTRTKAERGDRLSRGERLGAPARAQPLRLARGVDGPTALRAIVGNCLRQVLGNASDIAHEAETTPAHLHQLRVGLRRLRTALRELGALSPQVDARWAEALAQLFARLGAARDRDALEQTLFPALRRAGVLDTPWPQGEPQPTAREALCESATTELWLGLLDFAAAEGETGPPAAELLQPRLQHLFRQVRRDAARFADLDDTLRHRLRKRLKRLRYLSEFAASLYRGKDVRAFLDAMGPAQDALGAYNDVCVTRAMFDAAAPHDASASFALGWLAHEREDGIARCARKLARLRKAKPFW